jgi:hypothetical protein
MTATSSQDARTSASLHLFSAQLRLVDDPDSQDVVQALSALRDALQRPHLRLVQGGRDAAATVDG